MRNHEKMCQELPLSRAPSNSALLALGSLAYQEIKAKKAEAKKAEAEKAEAKKEASKSRANLAGEPRSCVCMCSLSEPQQGHPPF